MLILEEQNRLIRNDLAVVFFLEEGAEFDPSQVFLLGSPLVFIVVTPCQDQYRFV